MLRLARSPLVHSGKEPRIVNMKADTAVIFEPVDTPLPASLEEKFSDWLRTLSVLDRQLLMDHMSDSTPPAQVLDLFKYAPIPDADWDAAKGRNCYPEALLQALNRERGI